MQTPEERLKELDDYITQANAQMSAYMKYSGLAEPTISSEDDYDEKLRDADSDYKISMLNTALHLFRYHESIREVKRDFGIN